MSWIQCLDFTSALNSIAPSYIFSFCGGWPNLDWSVLGCLAATEMEERGRPKLGGSAALVKKKCKHLPIDPGLKFGKWRSRHLGKYKFLFFGYYMQGQTGRVFQLRVRSGSGIENIFRVGSGRVSGICIKYQINWVLWGIEILIGYSLSISLISYTF